MSNIVKIKAYVELNKHVLQTEPEVRTLTWYKVIKYWQLELPVVTSQYCLGVNE